MAGYHGLTEVEKTCLLTCIFRCKAVREAEASSPLRALDTSHDERALRALTGGSAAEASDALPEDLKAFDSGCVVARALEFDRLLLAHGPKQVVTLGCGMEFRSWRLPWPTEGITAFEVDSAAVLEVRSRAAEALGPPPRCRRQAVSCDIASWDSLEAALLAHAFDRSTATVWLAEGLLGYLTTDAMARLFQGTKAISASGSRFIASGPPVPSERKPWMSNLTFEESDATIRRAVSAGWALAELITATDVTRRYGVSIPQDLFALRC
jgi:methyltransferase (TIGR00027 family)